MKLRLVTMMTWQLPVPTTWMSPDLGTYPVDGDCPTWQRKMRATHGAPADVRRVRIGSSTGRLKCFERDCTGVH